MILPTVEIRFDKPMPIHAPNRCLPCDVCETTTPHALNWTRTHYVCGICSTEIVYHVNAAADGKGMNTREVAGAQDRFDNWCEDQQW